MIRDHSWKTAVWMVVGLGVASCSSSPSQPSTTYLDLVNTPSLDVACSALPALTCSAFLYGEGDVTAKATWSAADSFRLGMDVPATPSSAVVFSSPGVPTVLREANVYIRADYDSNRFGHMRTIAPYEYAVRPGGPVVPLAYLTGTVFVGGIPGTGTVGGALVQVVDGQDAGKRQVTLDANGSYMIEFMHLNAPFTATASKPGYSTDVAHSSGIVDPQGYPTNNALHFSISPQ